MQSYSLEYSLLKLIKLGVNSSELLIIIHEFRHVANRETDRHLLTNMYTRVPSNLTGACMFCLIIVESVLGQLVDSLESMY